MTVASPPEPVRTTVVIATYNRPDALRHAIRSVQLQSERSWQMIVIGDHCAPETAASIAGLGDPRIRYVNLPQRCGEQATPNSVGLALADTPCVAFLNHDDVWLPDHLATGLAALDDGAEFFAGRAAFASDPQDGDGRAGPVFTEANPLDRTYEQAYRGPFFLFEPVSAWVLRREAAARVGRFAPGAEVYRSPLQDWVLRAWRADLSLATSAQITVLKNNARIARHGSAASYDHEVNGLSAWLAEIEAGRAGALRAAVMDDLVRFADRARDLQSCFWFSPDLDARLREALTPVSAAEFRATGEDAADAACEAAGHGRGWLMRAVLKGRTGEDLPAPPDLDALIAFARGALARSGQ